MGDRLNIAAKLWYLNIVFLFIVMLGIILIFFDKRDSTIIITTMIGIPTGAFAAEMNIYALMAGKINKKMIDKKENQND